MRRILLLAGCVLLLCLVLIACTKTTCVTDTNTGVQVCQEEKGALDTWDSFLQGPMFLVLLGFAIVIGLLGWLGDKWRGK